MESLEIGWLLSGSSQTQVQVQGNFRGARMLEGQLGRMASVRHFPLPLCQNQQFCQAGKVSQRTSIFNRFFAVHGQGWSRNRFDACASIENAKQNLEVESECAVKISPDDLSARTCSVAQEEQAREYFIPQFMRRGKARGLQMSVVEQHLEQFRFPNTGSSRPVPFSLQNGQNVSTDIAAGRGSQDSAKAQWDAAGDQFLRESLVKRGVAEFDEHSDVVREASLIDDGEPDSSQPVGTFEAGIPGLDIVQAPDLDTNQSQNGGRVELAASFVPSIVDEGSLRGNTTAKVRTKQPEGFRNSKVGGDIQAAYSDTQKSHDQKQSTLVNENLSAALDVSSTIDSGSLKGNAIGSSNKKQQRAVSSRGKNGIASSKSSKVSEAPAVVAEIDIPEWDNRRVLVVNNVDIARSVVKLLRENYFDLTHACDTEVAGIDVKRETPVGHGRVICVSIYCGEAADFGDGRSGLWVDVLDGGEEVLQVFKEYFEDPRIRKVWHNYSFDYHVLCSHGIRASGFHADTMHLARLWDSSRSGEKGGYSLEALSSDEQVMNGHAPKAKVGDDPDDEDPNKKVGHEPEKKVVPARDILPGKISIKDMFGKANVKKDGTEGKLKVLPPVEELQRGLEREKWIFYSSFDAVCTWRLWYSLWEKLKHTDWEGDPVELGRGSLYDFYESYWQPFGQLLVQMECDGMLVDVDYLKEIEKTACHQQQIAASRFRKWAAKRCPDAAYMNVASDSQIRQLLFGGTSNRNNPAQQLPIERVFNVPNVEGYIEEGKKVPKKTRPIVLRGLGAAISCDTYTTAGWPTVSGAFLKALAGKVAIDYSSFEEDIDEMELLDEDGTDLSSTKEIIKSSEDVSMYGKAYAAFGQGEEGKDACIAFAALCEVAAINTLISNFIEPLQGSEVKGPDGRVHCSLNINTETGRLSARRPSLQNQPALEKDRYKIRRSFIAKPGNSLVVADYGQLELRLLAHLANCKSMLEAFEAGGDFHSRTAMNMYEHVREAVASGNVLLEWEPQPGMDKPPAPLLKDKFSSERRKAKMLNFSIAYGKTAVGLSKDWKVSLNEAEETLRLWYKDRTEVRVWQEARREEAETTHRVHTLLGRTRHLPDASSHNRLLKSHSLRAAINTPVQGSAADVAMCAMLQISRNKELKDLGWKLLLQVHDEVILEGPTESVRRAKELVVHSMSYPFNGRNPLSVALAVDADFGQSWYDAK